jgi:hypothetical protein
MLLVLSVQLLASLPLPWNPAAAVDLGTAGSRLQEISRRTPAPPAKRNAVKAPHPVRILIPAIGVNAPVEPLGLSPRGRLAVPERFSVTGWWRGGAAPGVPGAAVIVGHLDSYRGPAVFYRLGALEVGDEITVVRSDGSAVRFFVSKKATYPKDAFPTGRVYGATRRPTLRLITCAGSFDYAVRHYEDNLIVFAKGPVSPLLPRGA